MLVEYVKRHLVRIIIGLLILAFFAVHVSGATRWQFIERMEAFAYDIRLVFTMPRSIDPDIVILDIDEKSLSAEGRWPWSRAKIARLVDQLFDTYGASMVGFDVVFAEPEEVSGLQVLDQLEASPVGSRPEFAAAAQGLRQSLDHDSRLARSIEGRPVILGFFLSDREDGEASRIGLLPDPVFTADDFSGRTIPFVKAVGYSANLPALQRSALAAGHLMSLPDEDGVVRRVPMLYEHDGKYYESLTLAMARVALGVARVEPGFPEQTFATSKYLGMEWLKVGPAVVPVDESVRALVPYRGPQGSFPYVSATDVIRGAAEKEVIEGKIVMVGTTAKGLLDLRATPVAPDYPGVEAHANLLAGILDGNVKDNPAYILGAEFILIALSGLVMVLVLPALSPLLSAATTIVLLLGVVGVNLLIWQYANFVFPIASGVMVVLTLFLFNMTWGFFVETRGKRQLAGRFGQYVPPELVDEMSVNPDAFTMETTNRELTVLFSDVRGFTTISEGLNPQELSELMNAFLTPMTRIIYDHRGTIDKYMGDAVMAFWGAPVPDPDHARDALSAAMTMIARVAELRKEFQQRGWPPIRVGVGLNTGGMNVGNMGSEFRVAYTVMGDAVNLGSRLEGLTKGYGVELIVSETTAAAVPEFAYREIDRVRVKGKDKPVTIYEPMGPAAEIEKDDRRELKLYQEALKLYRAQNWDMAELQFLNLQKQSPGRALYGIYVERISEYRKAPPGDGWDGVFTHETK